MRSVRFCYSLDYFEWLATVTRTFDTWLDHALARGGVNNVHVDHKILELIAVFVPSSPRQLMELGMQCGALLDISIEDDIFGHVADDAYEGLRIAVSRFLAEELETRWETRKLDDAEPAPTPSGGDGFKRSADGADNGST